MGHLRRNICALASAALLGAGLSAQGDVLTQLKVQPSRAQEAVMGALEGGWIMTGLGAAFLAASPETRARLATAGVAWAKAHVASPEFRARYAASCEAKKPKAPAFDGTPEEEMARRKAKQAEGLDTEEMKKAMANLPPETRKEMEEAIKAAAAVMKEMDTPEMRKMELDGIRAERASKEKSHADALARWRTTCDPATPDALLRRRLQTFLDVSATVDFDATLEPRDGKMRFAKPEYERKSAEWKMCYRAGREAVAAARTAVEGWLRELR